MAGSNDMVIFGLIILFLWAHQKENVSIEEPSNSCTGNKCMEKDGNDIAEANYNTPAPAVILDKTLDNDGIAAGKSENFSGLLDSCVNATSQHRYLWQFQYYFVSICFYSRENRG